MSKNQLVTTRGLPGSGKDAFALEWVAYDPSNRLRVNRDMIREQMYGQFVLDHEREQVVTHVQRAMVEAGLREGKSVIVSDTNLRAATIRDWMKVARKYGADFTVHDIDTPLEECIRRNKARGEAGGRFVPERVIKDFYSRYMRKGKFPPLPVLEDEPASGPQPYVDDPTLPEIALVDLDGTIAHNNGHRGFFEWHKVGDDSAIEAVVNMVLRLDEAGVGIVFMSGRDEVCRKETSEWIERHLGFYPKHLYMRPEGNMEKDSIIKARLFDEHIRGKYRVVAVFDDRLSVCRTWHAMGLPLFRVGDPDADF